MSWPHSWDFNKGVEKYFCVLAHLNWTWHISWQRVQCGKLHENESEKEINLILSSIPVPFQNLTRNTNHITTKFWFHRSESPLNYLTHPCPHPVLNIYEHSFYLKQLSIANCYINKRNLKFSTETDGLPSSPLQSLSYWKLSQKSQTIHQLDRFYDMFVITQDGVSVRTCLSESHYFDLEKVFNILKNQYLCKHEYFPFFFLKKWSLVPSNLLFFGMLLSRNQGNVYLLLHENVYRVYTYPKTSL